MSNETPCWCISHHSRSKVCVLQPSASPCGPRVQVVQDRMAAVEMMLLQKPIVSGQYTCHAFRHFVLPLDPYFRKVMTRWASLSLTMQSGLVLPTPHLLACM